MRYRKVYGQSRDDKCEFCENQATTVNKQGVPACRHHKEKILEDKKCVCGEYMEIKKGKFGVFFLCANCGPISLSKAKDMQNGQGKFKINKKFRNDHIREQSQKKEKVYTIKELEQMWDDKVIHKR